jgi:hypothetical protein
MRFRRSCVAKQPVEGNCHRKQQLVNEGEWQASPCVVRSTSWRLPAAEAYPQGTEGEQVP